MSHIKQLPQELEKVAKQELNETAERIPNDLQALKEWIAQQPHLNVRQDDKFLIQFLRGSKYSLERAKEKLDGYYTLKSKFPELLNLTNVDDPKFRQSKRLGNICVLPEPLNGNGPRIVILRYTKDDFQVSIEELLQNCFSVFEILLMEDPYACVNGFSLIVDYAECTTRHVLRFTPGLIKKMITFFEMCLPLRIKSILLINTQPALNQFVSLILSLVSSKLRERIMILGKDQAQLHKFMPKKYLPNEYGGDNGTMPELIKQFEHKYDEYREYFRANAEYGANEKLRIGKAMDFDTMFGMGGSFRKLDVD